MEIAIGIAVFAAIIGIGIAILAFSFLRPPRPERIETIDIDLTSNVNWICRSSYCNYEGNWAVTTSANFGEEAELLSVSVHLVQFNEAGDRAVNQVLIGDEATGGFELATTNRQFFPATGLYKISIRAQTVGGFINAKTIEVFFNFEDSFQYLDFGRSSGSPSVYMDPQRAFYRRAFSFLSPDADNVAVPELVDNDKKAALIRTCPKSMKLEKIEYLEGYHPVIGSGEPNLGVRTILVSVSRPGDSSPIETIEIPRQSTKDLAQSLIVEQGIETLVEVRDPDRSGYSVSNTTYSIAFHFSRIP
ncbi:hypothetical protein M0C34_09990 [Agarivorans sp. TSD2052]|uniref:hypothetical protein n=1 Tax=Agarivorans sp. TSD2052 TaxID=2937286 RepID=UPI00200FFCBC|nr:hypothetical protein [Agarivorans sp. TSD2052]UPW20557.1 hypothetical protein M0C34_09990 [Agarivorans sp. TSD2052]